MADIESFWPRPEQFCFLTDTLAIAIDHPHKHYLFFWAASSKDRELLGWMLEPESLDTINSGIVVSGVYKKVSINGHVRHIGWVRRVDSSGNTVSINEHI